MNTNFSFEENWVKNLGLLIENCRQEYLNESRRNNLQHQVNVFINHRINIDSLRQEETAFPIFTQDDEWILDPHLCWVGGDLPIAFLLLKASIVLQSVDLQKLSNAIGLFTLMRKSREQTLVSSSSFREGSSGLALLYQSFYRTSGIEKYQQGADFWRKQTDIFLREERVADFYQQQPQQYLELMEALEEYETQSNGVWRKERRINFWEK